MESEKVKEIKYYLEQSACMYGNMQKQTLTLINELESENENLSAIVKAHKYCVTSKHCLEVKTLKDRIAELEKEKIEQLKQFAEMMKEKIKSLDKWYSEEIIDMQYNGITATDIDETLKEFIK